MTPNYAGAVDVASCSGISGWVADRNRLGTPITVSLWDGATQIASATANGSRSDVGSFLGDNGLHGFALQLPSSYANGLSHTLQAHYESSATQVGPSATLTCGSLATNPNYTGFVDALTCSSILGWAADRNNLNTAINVSLYDGSTLLQTIAANGSRPDVGAALGDNGVHGYSIATPAALKNGLAHTVTVRAGSSSSALVGPQSLTCPGGIGKHEICCSYKEID